MNRAFDAIDKAIDAAAFSLKAVLPFPRSAPWGSRGVPRTRYNYTADIGQGLESNVVMAVVGWIVRNFGEAPVVLARLNTVGDKVEEQRILPADFGPGYMLRLLDNPNQFYSGNLLQKAVLLDYETTGNGYIWKRRSDGNRVVELWWLPKMYTRPIWNPDGSTYIDAYRYAPNGAWIDIPPEDVIHLRDGLDPYTGREGMSKLASLVREVFTDEEASAFTATVLQNMGAPSVILSPKDVPGPNQRRIEDPDTITRTFKEKTSGDRRGEPITMSAPTQVDVVAWSPQQLGLRDLRRITEERVSAVYGVAAIVAGLGAGLDRSTFANFGEARQASYEENIIPKQGDWAREFRHQLLSEFVSDPLNYRVYYDVGKVRVMQENQDELWKRSLSALGGGGITRRRFKEIIGETADDTDDVYYLDSRVVVINSKEVPPPLEAEKPPEPPPVMMLPPGVPKVQVPGDNLKPTNGNQHTAVPAR